MADGEIPGPLDAAIEAAYAAVHEPDRWRETVSRYADALDAPMGGLLTPPLVGASPRLFVLHNIDVNPILDRFHIYGLQAPFAARAFEMGLAPGVFIHDEVIPPEELHRTDYYQEYMRPVGVEHGVQAVLRAWDNESPGPIVLTVGRGPNAKAFGDAEKSLARLAFPHLRRAVGLALDLNPARALDPAIRDALDGFDTACCLLGQDGRLVFANARARDLLRDGVTLRIRRDRVQALDPQTDGALARAIARACDIDANWSARAGSEVILPREDKAPLLAVVVPLGHHNPFLNVGPLRAAVYILDSSVRAVAEPELARLRRLFALTRAEAEVAADLIQGRSIAHIADQRGASVHTVKTQVKLILEKTQSTRQGDLAPLQRLLAIRR